MANFSGLSADGVDPIINIWHCTIDLIFEVLIPIEDINFNIGIIYSSQDDPYSLALYRSR